jgi:hypothetical protein
MSVANLHALLAPIVAPGPLIFADQNGTRPAKPFSTLSVRSSTPITVVRHKPDTVGIETLDQLLRRTVEVQFFGAGSEEKAEAVALKLRYHTHVLRAETLGLGVSTIRSVTGLAELLNSSQFEERAILEFTVNDNVAGDDDVGLIEHVEIAGDGYCQQTIDSPTAS